MLKDTLQAHQRHKARPTKIIKSKMKEVDKSSTGKFDLQRSGFSFALKVWRSELSLVDAGGEFQREGAVHVGGERRCPSEERRLREQAWK